MLTIQPKDDSFCTVKCKAKHNRKRHAVEWWYECSKCGHTISLWLSSLAEEQVVIIGGSQMLRNLFLRSRKKGGVPSCVARLGKYLGLRVPLRGAWGFQQVPSGAH